MLSIPHLSDGHRLPQGLVPPTPASLCPRVRCVKTPGLHHSLPLPGSPVSGKSLTSLLSCLHFRFLMPSLQAARQGLFHHQPGSDLTPGYNERPTYPPQTLDSTHKDLAWPPAQRPALGQQLALDTDRLSHERSPVRLLSNHSFGRN